MIILMIKSLLRFKNIKNSALPLQNQAVRKLYQNCLDKMHITKPVPVYSTAFLRSPVIVGLFKPCIYLPIHLISDYPADGIRYMLMHELAHYRYKDALANYFMSIIGVLYWFNPFVWYSLKEMKKDREIACDTSVLKLLDADAYEDYGNTLINFAEKVSLTPFPFTTGISESMKQMQNSVTWYFQALDQQASLSSIKEYIQKTGYGNMCIEGDLSSYWINSSLKISPVEQVELLKKLYYNQFGFSPENINAVKDSIRLYSTDHGTLSGKTGTEEVNGKNASG